MTDGTDDILAAEYVLGTLEDRGSVDRRIATEPAFAACVAEWEQHLSALNDEFDEVRPPNLLSVTEARIFGRTRQRWTWFGLGGLVAASLAVFLIVAPPQEQLLTFRLAAEGQALVVETSVAPASGLVRLQRVAGPAAPAGQSYEGWIIRPGHTPESLGVLEDAPSTANAPDLPDGTVIAITLEQDGGSPTGQPQGPIILNVVLDI